LEPVGRSHEDAVPRHLATVEVKTPLRDAAEPHGPVALADGHARRVALDEDAADTLRAGTIAQPAGDEVEPRRPRARDPALLPAERVAAGRLVAARGEVGGRGSGLALGDADGRRVTLEQPREVE